MVHQRPGLGNGRGRRCRQCNHERIIAQYIEGNQPPDCPPRCRIGAGSVSSRRRFGGWFPFRVACAARAFLCPLSAERAAALVRPHGRLACDLSSDVGDHELAMPHGRGALRSHRAVRYPLRADPSLNFRVEMIGPCIVRVRSSSDSRYGVPWTKIGNPPKRKNVLS
jgi:hypothetical protein